MALLTVEEIDRISPFIKDLEKEEPVISAWRYHIRKGEKRSKNEFRFIKDFVKKIIYGRKKIILPGKKEIVILIYSSTPSTSGSLMPVIKGLSETDIKPYLIVSRSTWSLINDYKGNICEIDNIMFSKFFDSKTVKKIKRKAVDLANEIERRLNGSIDVEYNWIYVGLMAKKFAERCEARFVLADSDEEAFRKGFFLGTNESAILQHGFFNNRLFPIHSKYHFDWGPYFSKKAEEYGHPVERSISIGCPRFDVIEKIKKDKRDPNFFKKYGIEKKPVVLAISGVHIFNLYPESIELFFETLKKMLKSGIEVVIKKHPAEADEKIYNRFLGGELMSKVKFAYINEDFHRLLFNCDFVYTNASTASLEAMLLGVPVGWQEGAKENPFPDIPLLGGGIYVNRDNIKDIVKEIGGDSIERKKFLERQEVFLSEAIVNRGTATNKAIDFIKNFY